MARRKPDTTAVPSRQEPLVAPIADPLSTLITETYAKLETARWRARSDLESISGYAKNLEQRAREMVELAGRTSPEPSAFGMLWIHNYNESLTEATKNYRAHVEEAHAHLELLQRLRGCCAGLMLGQSNVKANVARLRRLLGEVGDAGPVTIGPRDINADACAPDCASCIAGDHDECGVGCHDAPPATAD